MLTALYVVAAWVGVCLLCGLILGALYAVEVWARTRNRSYASRTR